MSLSFVNCSGKLNKWVHGGGCENLQSEASWSEAQITAWTCNWSLNGEEGALQD